ncbi:hypothetical protein C9374_006265 [Naegleria lovaniensis]|uniref:Uncharacterized protein n=1 Tax=Naegleria lovaniensis TaxID=51637 RepID=A0AA88KMB2_NAELO|nr:uncharacterized protein C9374_006265 [Naegleria lovaniensis]KAG2381276.1 hypothetical protein C9374_006265 [Naegleria lovaniensis]
MIVPIELLNSVFIYYVDKNKHPHKEKQDDDDTSSSSPSLETSSDDQPRLSITPPFNLNDAMNTSFHYFHNSKFKIGSSVMAHTFNAFPLGVSISKIEESRFGNSLFVVLFENGTCFMVEKSNIHKIAVGEKIIDISTTENHFICCSKKKVFHIKTFETYNEIKGLTLGDGEVIKKLETGRKFFIILTNLGRIFGFGHNKQKNFGNMDEQLKALTPINFTDDKLQVSDIRADYDHVVLLTSDKRLWMSGISTENPKWKYNFEVFTEVDNNVDWIFFRGNTLVYHRMNRYFSIGQELFNPNFIYYPTALFFKFKIDNFFGYKNQFLFQDQRTLDCYYFSTTFGLIKLDDINRILKEIPFVKPRFYCSDPSTAIIYFNIGNNISYLTLGLYSILKERNGSFLSDIAIKF